MTNTMNVIEKLIELFEQLYQETEGSFLRSKNITVTFINTLCEKIINHNLLFFMCLLFVR